eukprot:CAMPEP_0119038418 /NCGR_PEP_ID=MMETSP1177-20130426/7355_1 /TAXON_ID=2985 /ORGANISM="Ochromonas sp, Strain CCMP1899" /LENGTH=481 /DNA_ID=CAMNT_0007001005 /DNA_START=733 /DNA_END=2178 /DNA_ORIENTATION=-
MEGVVSSGLYNDILETRGFDIYGRLKSKAIIEEQKDHRIDQNVEIEEIIDQIDVFQKEKDDLLLRRLPLITPKWKLGEIEDYNAPVGFAKNPRKGYHSLGNEGYYSYDGEWKNGKMHGLGSYIYSDGLRFDGQFIENTMEGIGTSQYIGEGVSYEGAWRKGKFHGEGRMKCKGGSMYKGEFVTGRRERQGRLDYGVGLSYEGEFLDGKPNGRGIMASSLSGYSFEGTFVRGRICGSGTLITPYPSSQRIVRYWGKEEGKTTDVDEFEEDMESEMGTESEYESEDGEINETYEEKLERENEKILRAEIIKIEKKKDKERIDTTADGYLLQDIIKVYLDEIETKAEIEKKRNYLNFGILKALKLNDYVAACRQRLHQGRIDGKKRAIMDRIQKQEDMRADIKKARQAAVEQMQEAEKQQKNAFSAMIAKMGYERQKTIDELYLEKDQDDDKLKAERKAKEEAQESAEAEQDGVWGGERPKTPS